MAYVYDFKRKKPKKQLPSFRDMVSTMYDKRVFCMDAIHRKFISVASFSSEKNIYNRDYDYSFRIWNKRLDCGASGFYNYQLDGTIRFQIQWTTTHRYQMQFEFTASTNKEFLHKLLKFNLIE